ncbi:hypothetical protein CDO73_10205 [Saccharibacillus sp. O23]|uniref:hypothetical protein n=1 Tax=Saccharibacillus sp. O23 TaxID=2009338 RepID=UPI000B4E1A67|nr:hypothetical protein [Saccharibacillus sp. O23]OWR30947.1 hypothetical protein CDO73_10205 [Saccharibacillus sp. O23]
MKKHNRIFPAKRTFLIGTISLFVLFLLSACGFSGVPQSASPDSADPAQPTTVADTAASDAIRVEVLVESDGDSAANFKAEIDARKNPQSASYDTIELPYRETFEVSKDAFIPLPSVRLQADAADDAEWISCKIFYDGEEVATHMSRGDGAQAICEKKFHLGPG